jgi:predicted short-subunit dehydrogenase-like oxidoreductase (DUF2520 family)
MNIVLIGAGNVATILGKKLHQVGHTIVQVWSRKIEAANTLAVDLNAVSINNINDIAQHADVYIIAIADAAIIQMATQIKVNNAIVVHTAGAISKYALQQASANYGVLYPLQSLNKINANLDIPIPLLIDANNEKNIQIIQTLANSISTDVTTVNDEDRLHLHLAAVIVNNFTNHLYALANNYCIKYGIDFKKLQPLIEETANKLRYHAPENVQTGPAIRHDSATMTKHLQLLAGDEKLKFIYLKLSESILEM